MAAGEARSENGALCLALLCSRTTARARAGAPLAAADAHGLLECGSEHVVDALVIERTHLDVACCPYALCHGAAVLGRERAAALGLEELLSSLVVAEVGFGGDQDQRDRVAKVRYFGVPLRRDRRVSVLISRDGGSAASQTVADGAGVGRRHPVAR